MIMNNKNAWSKYRNTNLLIGFVISIAVCSMAFSYSTDSIQGALDADLYSISPDEIEILRTPAQKKEKKIIPPPDNIILKDIIEPIDDVVFKTELVPKTISDAEDPPFDSTFLDALDNTENTVLPRKPPPPKDFDEPKDLAPILFAEHMPYYGQCNKSEITRSEKKSCSDQAFIKYLMDNIKYPEIARENRVEGLAIVEIIIGKKGEIESAKILRDPGAGLGQEALRVIQNMNDWSPGRQGGKHVRIIMRLPVRFELK
jgi:protein TonB